MRTGRRAGALLAGAALLLAGCDGGADTADVASPAPADQAAPDDPSPSPNGEGGPVAPVPTSDEAEDGHEASAWRHLPAPPDAEPDEEVVGGAWTGEHYLLLTTASWGAEPPTRVRALDPTTGSWEPRAELDAALSPWSTHVLVVDGRVLVLGRGGGDFGRAAPGWELHVHDVAADQWWQADAPPLGGRWGPTATWVDGRLVVFGGLVEVAGDDGVPRFATLDDGWAWDLEQDGWYRLGQFPHRGRSGHGAVWNGRRLVVFGGGYASGRFTAEGESPWDDAATGAAAWDPATNAWTPIADPAPTGPILAAAWTGDRIVWWDGSVVGQDHDGRPGAGGIWDTDTGVVEPLAPPPFELRRDDAPALWVDELRRWVTWGGGCGEGCNQNVRDGGLWDPATNTWELLPAGHGLGRRLGPIAWTGEELLVVGGRIADQFANVHEPRLDGAAWRP